MAERLLLLFLKAPRPGQVKTRLAASLGEAVAADIARALAERVLDQTRPPAGEYDRVVVFTPADARAEIAGWLPGLELWPQQGDDLGARMGASFTQAFARSPRVVLVGSDVPALTHDHVGQAFAVLESADVALGPARDGGYYLIGLREPRPSLFTGVSWGTAGVCDETLARARRLGLSAHLLPALRDVDTVDDLRAEWPEICPALGLDGWKPSG